LKPEITQFDSEGSHQSYFGGESSPRDIRLLPQRLG